jgi:hypothetical protein
MRPITARPRQERGLGPLASQDRHSFARVIICVSICVGALTGGCSPILVVAGPAPALIGVVSSQDCTGPLRRSFNLPPRIPFALAAR